MNTTSNRLAGFVVAAMFGYIIMEASVKAAQQRRAQFVAWRDAFMERYNRNPGHREFLRDVLVREEMHVTRATAATTDDCGCD